MTPITQYGVLGAFLGLLFGVLDYALLNKLFYPRLRDHHEFAKLEQRQRIDPGVVMGVIKLACFTVFPAIGFIIGQELSRSYGL
jgi:hypothetical protein